MEYSRSTKRKVSTKVGGSGSIKLRASTLSSSKALNSKVGRRGALFMGSSQNTNGFMLLPMYVRIGGLDELYARMKADTVCLQNAEEIFYSSLYLC